MYDAGFTFHSTDGPRGAKEAGARRVLADTVVETCLSLLRNFPDLSFVILPEPPPASPTPWIMGESGPSSSGSLTKRSLTSVTDVSSQEDCYCVVTFDAWIPRLTGQSGRFGQTCRGHIRTLSERA